MSKVIAAVCILISSVLAFALVIIMIAGITGHTIFNWGVGNLRFYTGGDSVLVKEESVVLTDYKNLTLDVPSNTVYVRSTSSDKLTVRQYGPSNLDNGDIFTMNKSGDRVSVDMRNRNFRIMFFFWSKEYIEIEVPSDWHGNVDMKTSSGGIKIEDSFNWADISLRCTSGGIEVERGLNGSNISVSASSGGINLKGLLKADGNMSVKVSSGGIKTELLEAGSLDIQSSSGGMSLRDTVKTGDLYMRCTSGGIKTEAIETERFTVESSSGGMRIRELTGQGSIKCTSGGVKVDMLNPTGNVDIRATSGGITVDVPRDLAHFVSTRATSGGVHVNER